MSTPNWEPKWLSPFTSLKLVVEMPYLKTTPLCADKVIDDIVIIKKKHKTLVKPILLAVLFQHKVIKGEITKLKVIMGMSYERKVKVNYFKGKPNLIRDFGNFNYLSNLCKYLNIDLEVPFMVYSIKFVLIN